MPRDIDIVENGACGRRLVIALVGMEVHVALRQLAAVSVDRDVGDIENIRIDARDGRAWRLQLSEAGDQAALILDTDRLPAA